MSFSNKDLRIWRKDYKLRENLSIKTFSAIILYIWWVKIYKFHKKYDFAVWKPSLPYPTQRFIIFEFAVKDTNYFLPNILCCILLFIILFCILWGSNQRIFTILDLKTSSLDHSDMSAWLGLGTEQQPLDRLDCFTR